MVRCSGCIHDFSVTGLSLHLAKTQDARCEAVLASSHHGVYTPSPPAHNDAEMEDLEDGFLDPFDEDQTWHCDEHDESSSDEEDDREEHEWEPPVQEDEGVPGEEPQADDSTDNDNGSADHQTRHQVERRIIDQDGVHVVSYPDRRAGQPILLLSRARPCKRHPI
ncbi:hypothetical protein BDR06DRAFT_965578 [Suillus hirtellus]|nr:hypothetical protein BDR06DRAFT_965578 [Suillus hirtellus]